MYCTWAIERKLLSRGRGGEEYSSRVGRRVSWKDYGSPHVRKAAKTIRNRGVLHVDIGHGEGDDSLYDEWICCGP